MKKASSDLLLLDVNVLLAIAWPNHQFHAAATAALSRGNRWATCALTQLGFIRLSSNPAAVGTAKSPQEAAGLMALLAADSLHVYFDSLPAPAAAGWREAYAEILGHQQVTDAYLARLAAAHDAVLVTFDRRLENIARGKARARVLGADLAMGPAQRFSGRHRRRKEPERGARTGNGGLRASLGRNLARGT